MAPECSGKSQAQRIPRPPGNRYDVRLFDFLSQRSPDALPKV
jgi:hypothetical protein